MKGMRPLTDAEITAIAAKLGTRDRAFFILGIRTGFRVSELLSLRIADIEHAGEVGKDISVARKSMKGKTEGRTIPLHEEARAALAPWLLELFKRGAPIESPLFPSQKGGTISRQHAWAILNDAYRRAEVFGAIGVHGLRKTFAARVYALVDHDLLKTQKAMGHKSITSTQAYLSFADADVNDAILGIRNKK